MVLHKNVANAFSVEALACLQALIFVKDMGFRDVVKVYINEIIMMVLNFNLVSFQHADRDSNSVAHTIASMSFKLQNSLYWVEEVPLEAVEPLGFNFQMTRR